MPLFKLDTINQILSKKKSLKGSVEVCRAEEPSNPHQKHNVEIKFTY